MEKKMKNVWMGSFRLIINVVIFSLENGDLKVNQVNVENRDTGKMKSYGFKDQEDRRFKNFISSNKSYAGTMAGSHQTKINPKEVVVSEFVKPYKEQYDKAVIGRVKDLWTLRKMDVLLREARYGDSNTKYL
ncbi:hypothetical protein Hanom_Chr01g00017211 [Helianthus anomalus]